MLTMQYRIELKQLNLLHHLRILKDNNLAKEVFNVQNKYKFPGLITDMRKVIIRLKLPNIIDSTELNYTANEYKKMVKEALNRDCERANKREQKTEKWTND